MIENSIGPTDQSTSANPRFARNVLLTLSGVFLLVGLGATYPLLILPVQKHKDAKTWPETPCTIVSSRVDTETSTSSGDTYAPDIRYAYEFGGEQYHSGRWGFLRIHSSGYKSVLAKVQEHPVGSSAVCYVNPASPEEAVLDRAMGLGLLLGLIPAVFALFGFVGLVATLYGFRSRKPAWTDGRADWIPPQA